MRTESSADEKPSAADVAEAAAWVAHLHSSGRNADSDCGHKLWLKEAAGRQRAWELATDAWEDLQRLPTARVVKELESTRQGIRARRRNTGVIAALAVAVLAAFGGAWLWRGSGIATNVGEQRTVALEDGTQVTLNTATRIVVHFDEHTRRVELKSGEALFDVARQARRPFVVVAGAQEIKALGTAFVVRRDEDQVSVVLVDGAVAVSPASTPIDRAAPATVSALRPLVMAPGQRLTFAAKTPPKLDQPSLDKVTAWRRGKVVFEGTPLVSAIAEMNRYSEYRLSVEDPGAADMRISGVFKYGDLLRFAQAVAATYHLEVIEENEAIILRGIPRRAD